MPDPDKPARVTVRGRQLEVCRHGDCHNHRIWDLPTCWNHLTVGEREQLRVRLSDVLRERKPLPHIVLTGAELPGFDFSGVDLHEAFLDRCNLRGAKFIETNLRKAYLGWADLSGADLTRAELHGTVFTWTRLAEVDLAAYSISFGRTPINIRWMNFQPNRAVARARVNETEPSAAATTYQALKRYFVELGDYDSASWASFSERFMQRKSLWRQHRYLGWFGSLVFSAIAGYGERPRRVWGFALATVLWFALLYRLLDVVPKVPGAEGQASWVDALYFSLATLCTYAFADIVPRGGPFVRLLIALESFLGIFILGLFVFTLTRRYVAR